MSHVNMMGHRSFHSEEGVPFLMWLDFKLVDIWWIEDLGWESEQVFYVHLVTQEK